MNVECTGRDPGWLVLPDRTGCIHVSRCNDNGWTASLVPQDRTDCQSVCGYPYRFDRESKMCSPCIPGQTPTTTDDQDFSCRRVDASKKEYSPFGGEAMTCKWPNMVNNDGTACENCDKGKGTNAEATACDTCEGPKFSVGGLCLECGSENDLVEECGESEKVDEKCPRAMQPLANHTACGVRRASSHTLSYLTSASIWYRVLTFL